MSNTDNWFITNEKQPVVTERSSKTRFCDCCHKTIKAGTVFFVSAKQLAYDMNANLQLADTRKRFCRFDEALSFAKGSPDYLFRNSSHDWKS